MSMSNVREIEAALRQLPACEQWEIARWLLDELEEGAANGGNEQGSSSAQPLPDYAARRRRIFGEKVLPNMVLVSRSEEPW